MPSFRHLAFCCALSVLALPGGCQDNATATEPGAAKAHYPESCKAALAAKFNADASSSKSRSVCVDDLERAGSAAVDQFFFDYAASGAPFLTADDIDRISDLGTYASQDHLEVMQIRRAVLDGNTEPPAARARNEDPGLTLLQDWIDVERALGNSNISDARKKAASFAKHAAAIDGAAAREAFPYAYAIEAFNNGDFEGAAKFLVDGVNLYLIADASTLARITCTEFQRVLRRATDITIDEIAGMANAYPQTKGVAACVFSIAGMTAAKRDQHDRAIDLLSRANADSRSTPNKFLQSNIAHMTGTIAVIRSDFLTATEEFIRAIDLFEEDGIKSGPIAIYVNLGIIFRDLGDHERALSYFQDALNVINELGEESPFYHSDLETTNAQIGTSLADLQRHDEALPFFEASIATREIAGSRAPHNFIEFNYAESLFAVGRFEEGIQRVEGVIERSVASGDSKTAFICSAWLAAQLLDLGRPTEAERTLANAGIIDVATTEAIYDVEKTPLNSQVLFAKAMMKIAAARGDIETEAAYASKALRLSEQRHEETNLEAAANTDLLFKIRERDRALATASNDAAILALRLEKTQFRNMTFIFASLVSAIVAIAFLLLYRTKSQLAASKQLLIEELHHRTKDNLQLLISILNTGAEDGSASHDAATLRQDAALRAHAMALIQDRVFVANATAPIDFQDFVENLLRLLEDSLGRMSVQLHARIEPTDMDVEVATPLGLIICELVTNAYRHAFNNGDGAITVSFCKKDEKYMLRVEDDGIGFDAREIENSSSSGLKLVLRLAQQLKASCDVEAHECGTRWEVVFFNASKSSRKLLQTPMCIVVSGSSRLDVPPEQNSTSQGVFLIKSVPEFTLSISDICKIISKRADCYR